jgi:hypothetical protein
MGISLLVTGVPDQFGRLASPRDERYFYFGE